MNKLTNGDTYRATVNGYLWMHGNRQIYLIAKSVSAGEKARAIITSAAFNKYFNNAKRMAALGQNIRAIYLDK